MRLVLVGPPGAGKGTQAVRLAERLDVPHISTGDLFRANLKDETDLGREAKRYMDAGDLVPDEVTVAMVRERLTHDDAAKGFILDGFPRTVTQADALDSLLAKKGLKLDAVVELKVDEQALVDRIVKRAKETEARGESVRNDDNPEVFRTRLDAYRAQTAPLIAHYRAKGMLKSVDGMKPVDGVTDDLAAAIGA